MKKITGRFYFKRTNNNNLIGEFSNYNDSNIFTESADKITKSTDFSGKYKSTWQEDSVPIFANLTIKTRKGTVNKIFILEWEINSKTKYTGEAIICDSILIGDYKEI